ncbi:hypothetical protein HDU67_000465, partial [Dinochytrium kinnereticum]
MLEKDPASRATMDEVISHPWVCRTIPPVVRLEIAESASTAGASQGPLNIAQKAAAHTGQPTLSPQATITIRNRISGSSAGVQTLNTYEATPRAPLRVVNEGLGDSAGLESLNTSQSTSRATVADNNGGFGEVEGVESRNTSQSTQKATVALKFEGLGDVAGVETLKTSQSTQKAASTVDCEGLGGDAGHSIEPTSTSQAILVMNDKDLEKDLVLETDQSLVIREVPLVVKEDCSDAVDVPALKSETCLSPTVVAIRVDQKDDISAFSVAEDQLPRIHGFPLLLIFSNVWCLVFAVLGLILESYSVHPLFVKMCWILCGVCIGRSLTSVKRKSVEISLKNAKKNVQSSKNVQSMQWNMFTKRGRERVDILLLDAVPVPAPTRTMNVPSVTKSFPPPFEKSHIEELSPWLPRQTFPPHSVFAAPLSDAIPQLKNVVDTSSKMLGGDNDVDVDVVTCEPVQFKHTLVETMGVLVRLFLHCMRVFLCRGYLLGVLGDGGALVIAKVLWSIGVDIELHYSHPAELEGLMSRRLLFLVA